MRMPVMAMKVLALCAIVAQTWPMPARAGTAGLPDWERRCAALAGPTYIADDGVAKVVEAHAEDASVPGDARGQVHAVRGRVQGIPTLAHAEVPAHCRVSGYVSPNIRFELRLPAAAWNQRLLMVACDGFCGFVFSEACVPGLLRDYATVTSDGGHTAARLFDGAWGYRNPQAQIDFGYRANHVVAVAAKAIAAAFYGHPPRYAYLTGCSKGGSAGIMAAMRYPSDFDGVIAGAPVLDYQGKNAIHFPWVARALEDGAGRPLLGADKLPTIERAVLHACDRLDGQADRVIADPRRCRFDPASLQCPAGQRAADCLDPAQVAALRRVYDTPRDSRGRAIYAAGTVPGSEGNWRNWLFPGEDSPLSFSQRGAEEYLRYLAFEDDPGPGYDVRSFDLDTAVERLRPLSPVYDALDPDLRAYRDRGGKVILWHGWADAAISPLLTIDYYRALTDFMGGERSTAFFARLFLLPGVHHCRGGEGPGLIDALAALERWREHGEAPQMLLAAHDQDSDGRAERIRPVYPYPLQASYNGRGDPDDVRSYPPRRRP